MSINQARLRALLAELADVVGEFTEPDPVELLPLEDVDTSLGTMQFSYEPDRLDWTMKPNGRRKLGLGTMRINLYSTRVDVELKNTGAPSTFSDVDWDAFTDEVATLIPAAMRTKAGWASYRQHVAAESLSAHAARLTGSVKSVVGCADWVETCDAWHRIAIEPDPVVAHLAESLYVSEEFPGTVEQLFTAAHAAASKPEPERTTAAPLRSSQRGRPHADGRLSGPPVAQHRGPLTVDGTFNRPPKGGA